MAQTFHPTKQLLLPTKVRRLKHQGPTSYHPRSALRTSASGLCRSKPAAVAVDTTPPLATRRPLHNTEVQYSERQPHRILAWECSSESQVRATALSNPADPPQLVRQAHVTMAESALSSSSGTSGPKSSAAWAVPRPKRYWAVPRRKRHWYLLQERTVPGNLSYLPTMPAIASR